MTSQFTHASETPTTTAAPSPPVPAETRSQQCRRSHASLTEFVRASGRGSHGSTCGFPQRGRRWEFSRIELEELVQALAARPHLWQHLVKHSVGESVYVQLHLDDTLEVWLICWSQQQDAGFHDHNGSRGAVAVTDRSSRNAGWRWEVAPPLVVYGSGAVCSFGPSRIHDVGRTGAAQDAYRMLPLSSKADALRPWSSRVLERLAHQALGTELADQANANAELAKNSAPGLLFQEALHLGRLGRAGLVLDPRKHPRCYAEDDHVDIFRVAQRAGHTGIPLDGPHAGIQVELLAQRRR